MLKQSKIIVFIAIISICFFVLISDVFAVTFRYRFSEGDSLSYGFNIFSKVQILELEGLAMLFNLDNMTHSVVVDIDLRVKSFQHDVNAVIESDIQNVSMVLIMGDSLFVDDGSTWGALKANSEYTFVITPRGEITELNSPDSVISMQGVQMIQRFFPVFPETDIGKGYNWTDSIEIDFEMPDKKPASIKSQMTYIYKGIEVYNNKNVHRFEFSANGKTEDNTVTLTGDGYSYYDNKAGRMIYNSGNLIINADIEMSSFGLPVGKGNRVPIIIESEIETKLNNAK